MTEKLIRQERAIAEVQDQLNVADRQLRSIDSFWGMIANWFRRDNSQDHQNEFEKREKEFAQKRSSPRKESSVSEVVDHGLLCLILITNLEVSGIATERLDKSVLDVNMEKEDEHLSEILQMVQNIHSNATMLRENLDIQHARLSNLQNEVADTNARTKKHTLKAEKIRKGL